MELRAFLIAEYAANVAPENKLVIAGTYNTVQLTRKPGISKEDAAKSPVIIPPFYLAAILECGIAEGLVHRAVLRLLDEDGRQLASPMDLGELKFVLNPHGHPMLFHQVLRVNGLPVPGPGDYSFELVVDGKRVGETSLYVTDITAAS